MAQGRKTGGRIKGLSRNKRTVALDAATREAAEKIKEALGEGTFDGDGHALLMAVYKNPAFPVEIRIDAAKAAVGYEKPKLSSGNMKIESPLSDLLKDLDGRTRGLPNATKEAGVYDESTWDNATYA
jgi:hypothetical protein